jgi:hypothetical protein
MITGEQGAGCCKPVREDSTEKDPASTSPAVDFTV